MKKKKLKVVILVLVIIEGVFIYLNYKSYNKESTQVFSEVKIADNLKETKQIAIMQQKEDFTWEDKGTSASAWPSIETHEYYGSECIDASGNNITPTTDVIQFDEQNQTAIISTSKTIYCTLKFARRSKVLELMTETTDGAYLKTYDGKTAEQLEQGETTEDELLRYVGIQDDVTSNKLNNFICFGTENIDTCTQNPDTYMYRIIGITTKNVNTSLGLTKDQLKIIKATSPSDGTSVKWASDRDNGKYTWDYETTTETTGATARWYLNNTFLETITGKVGTHNWIDLITSPQWYKGDNTNANNSSGGKKEVATLTSTNYKIGLMYASDYYNSWTYAGNTNSWLNICHGLSSGSPECASSYSATFEWTMTRNGYSSGYGYLAWPVGESGALKFGHRVHYEYAVRPVFYLTRDISISGAGTESNPFIISDRIVS